MARFAWDRGERVVQVLDLRSNKRSHRWGESCGSAVAGNTTMFLEARIGRRLLLRPDFAEGGRGDVDALAVLRVGVVAGGVAEVEQVLE